MNWTLSLCSVVRLLWKVDLNRCHVAGLEVSGVFAWTVCPHDLDDVIVFVGLFVMEVALNRCYVAGLDVSGVFAWTVCPRDLDEGVRRFVCYGL